MAQEVVSVLIKSFSDITALKRFNTEMSKLDKETKQNAMLMDRFGKQTEERMNQAKQAVKNMKKEAQRFKGEWLSIMFFGMAITRVFGGFLRSATQTFNKINEGTSKANNGITQMAAAWEFFKYSFIETLMATELFQQIVKFVLWLAEAWSDLPDSIKKAVIELAVFAAALGALMTAAGIIRLGLAGVNTVLGEAGNLKYNLSAIIGIISISWSLVEAADAYKDFKEGKFAQGLTSALQAGLYGVGGITMFKNPKMGGALIAIGVALKIVDDNDSILTKSVKAIASYITAFFQTIGDYTGYLFGISFGDAMKNAVIDILTELFIKLSGLPFLSGIANQIRAIKEEIKAMAIGETFDFGANFWRNYRDNLSTLADAPTFAEAIDSVMFQQPTQTQPTTGPASYERYQSVYIDNLNVNADSSQELLVSLERVGYGEYSP